MTDNTIDTRLTADETKETGSRLLANNKHARKQTLSPSLSASYYRKGVRTPKHRLRRQFDCCTNGDSPSEAEALQDIIWDPASPPSMKNGKAAEESVRVVEISEIVKRIAPNKEKPVDKDSVLQWIGDTGIPCTPEIQKPRVPRYSARRQSNNVEDLMKLAKQFDLNMTRQHKERNYERLQTSNSVNCKDLHMLNKLTATRRESESDCALSDEAKKLSHEEKLHALFDGQAQHFSGRLLSNNFSQESETEKKNTNEMGPATSDKNLHEDAQVLEPHFNDDWESNDLLSDFVLTPCTVQPTSLIEFAASKKCKPTTAANSSGLISRACCSKTHQTSSKSCTNPSTFWSHDPDRSNAIMQLPKTSPDSANTVSACSTGYLSCGKQQMTTVDPRAKDLSTSAAASGEELDPVWGDEDNDDDLLYQACDDLERTSDSKDQQRHKNLSKVLYCSSKRSSSTITNTSSLSRGSRTVLPEHVTEHRKSVCIFARSHSIPGASGLYSNKQNFTASASQVAHYPKNTRQQDNFTRLRYATGPSGKNCHYSTFKRHQSDPVALKNKVFITAQPIVKCSAAEIERKKQEAIARRKLRLQATQKTAAHR